MTTVEAASCYFKNDVLMCQGDWDLAHFPALKKQIKSLPLPKKHDLTINGSAIKKMDSSGAWLLDTYIKKLEAKSIKVHLKEFSEEQSHLIQIIKDSAEKETVPPKPEVISWVTQIGKFTIGQYRGFIAYLSFIGLETMEALRLLRDSKHFRWGSLANVIYRNGFLALPIIALLSFMIGVVITYQMGLQLRNYGANAYIVDLLGLAILREFGPLLTAIMVAGRTGSAFTAQLGIMKINQEVDALDTMGVTPSELLLLPRIAGLFIALPLLTMWSDIFGIMGGMFMSSSMLNITTYDFLHRFPHVIKLKNLLIGLGKAPVFALIIASIGCFQGMQVEGSADSVGRNTTRSVVLAIFFIIVADAAFSVLFSKLKL